MKTLLWETDYARLEFEEKEYLGGAFGMTFEGRWFYLTIKEGVKTIGREIWRERNFAHGPFAERREVVISMPNSVTAIGSGAFSNVPIREIVIPDSVEKIGEYAFYGCEDLEEITLPRALTEIGYAAFGYCKVLKRIEIPEAVTKIDDRAFNHCRELTRVEIPETR